MRGMGGHGGQGGVGGQTPIRGMGGHGGLIRTTIGKQQGGGHGGQQSEQPQLGAWALKAVNSISEYISQTLLKKGPSGQGKIGSSGDK